MFCQHCGCKNKDGAKFCVNCGTPFADLAKDEVIEVEPKEADTTIIENKFEDIKNDDVKPLESDVEIIPEEPIVNNNVTYEKPKKKKTWLVVLIVILILGLVGFGLYYFVFNKKVETTKSIDLTNSISCNIEVVDGTSSCDIDWNSLKNNYGSSVSYNYEAIEQLANERGLDYSSIKSYFDGTNPIDDLKSIINFEGSINENGEVDYNITCKDEALLKLYNFDVVMGSGTIKIK